MKKWCSGVVAHIGARRKIKKITCCNAILFSCFFYVYIGSNYTTTPLPPICYAVSTQRCASWRKRLKENEITVILLVCLVKYHYLCSIKGRISDARFTGAKPWERYRLGESYVALMLLLCSSYSGWEVYGCSWGGSQRQKVSIIINN